MIKIIKPDFKFNDERGELVQLIHDGFKQVNVIKSSAGAVRGGHYHKINVEAFYIIDGKLELTLEKDNLIKNFHFNTGDMFMVSEYVTHSFIFLADTLLISMYNKGVELDNGTKDMY